ncbi:GAF domain-containing protein [Actinoplanes sp. N902-109]|uniref:GAF domain-containing protein n=1 Tax=Actinoplanes sp. (strain N902-109) TaxID=649831 RepID=UPI0003293FA7|nr:helix-turn-helix domain-containing protein [Actinoplanes sp. N902-109]AGL14671.1 GAF domain-containing protein [Actinoplanes sp. N902-109]
MPDPWLALDLGADPVERISRIGRAHERFLTGSPTTPPDVRDVVAQSWRRSAGASVSPDSTAPIDLGDQELEAYRAAHPLSRVMPIFRDLLGGLAEDGAHLMAVCDAHGRLLWVEGNAAVRRGAESMNFVPGARWDEAHAGTNAPGTALAVDRSVQIFATEHFSRGVQRWTCAAAPIHDPATGMLLGAIDVTGGDHLAHPHSLALVRATALAAEAYLGAQVPRTPTVSVLGRADAVVTIGAKKRRLSRRHSELLCLLLVHPDGRTGEQLGFDLYADDLNPVTVRAELSRLRRILGPELLDSRPYRLRGDVMADFLTVTRLLDRDAVANALKAYAGPLLPSSDAPGVVRLRDLIDARLRGAVLAAGDPSLIRTWLDTPWGAEDLQMWEAYAATLPQGSPARLLALDRIVRLSAEYGIATSVQRPRN